MPRKENTKAITWERDRRKRMNTYFKTLADLLPPQQEGRKRNKVDILIQASKYIKDLHNRMEDLFTTHASEAHKEELARLKKLVALLFSRTQLLSTLLREAGISVPAEPALEKLSALKWSNKINVEDAEKHLENLEERKSPEKKTVKSAESKVPSKKKSISSSRSSSKKVTKDVSISETTNSCIENQENRVNCANNKDDGIESTGGESEVGSKEVDSTPTDATPTSDSSTTRILNGKKKNVLQKVDSKKKTKKKTKKLDEKKPSEPCIKNPIPNFTPNTLILSGGKLMPLVTPMNSNIIVNTQPQPPNPIILGNTQQNQMFVMQPLTNRVQNSVVSICNQALINTVQKVTINTVPSIPAKMVVDSQNWASNVKNIINATKIGGHKGILPKGKEVTKTTMTYKVPIPAVHREKVDKTKESLSKKEPETKVRSCKNSQKSTKNQQTSESVERKSEKEETAKTEDVNASQKGSLKRTLPVDTVSTEEPGDKKRKIIEDAETTSKVVLSSSTTTDSCTVSNNVSENGKLTPSQTAEEDANASNTVENTTSNENSNSTPVAESNTVEMKTSSSSSSPSIDSLTPSMTNNSKTEETKSSSEAVSSITFTEETVKTNNLTIASPSTDFNMPVKNTIEKPSENPEPSTTKSPLAEIEGKIQEEADLKKVKEDCNLQTQFDSLLQISKESETVESSSNIENNKIILNLDTNTTTTLKSESSVVVQTTEASASSSVLLPATILDDESKMGKSSKDELSKTLSYTPENTFVPIGNRTDGLHSDLSNDIFASLQVPSSSHNPESISPTAAFLMAFPLVSSLNGKTEVLDEEMKEDFKYHSQTPPMLLQIGTMEPNSFKLKSNSPSHNIAEKRLKMACEEKKIDSVGNETANTDIIPPVECSQPTKALPKIVNNETLREPYKIVQGVLTPPLEKPVSSSSSFTHSSLQPVNIVSSTSVATNTTTTANCRNVLPSSTQNTISNSTNDSTSVSQVRITVTSPTNKVEAVQCPVQESQCENTVRYSTSQDFLRCYSTPADNNLRTMQQTSTVFSSSNSSVQEGNSTLAQNVASDVPHSTLITHLSNGTPAANSSSLPLPMVENYPPPITEKDSQTGQQVDNNLVSNNRLPYTNHLDRILPSSSQNRQDYPMQTKDSSLPILSSQAVQPIYNTQAKDSHMSLSTIHSTQQTFPIHEKDHIIQNNEYNVDHNKNLPRKDSIAYSATPGNANSSTQSQSYSSKDASSNSDNHFQRNYPKLCKNSDSQNTPNMDQSSKLNNVLQSKPQEQQDHRRDSNYASSKKIDVDPFSQSFSYGVKEPISTQSGQNILNPTGDSLFQEKRENTQNYTSYPNKEMKKINTSSTNSITSKSIVQNTSLPQYPQQSTSFVATSNYEQSTVTDNNAKSTTTVAHNSSNFSILSWTTFSPVSGGGNNNLVHFEQGPSQADNTEGKTICENYNYVPLHKENPGFSNVLPNDSYPVNSTVASMDKSRMKTGIESQKTSYVDPSKSRNIQGTVPAAPKQNRMQNQTSSGTNDYKYTGDGKNKSKFGMESDYMQNEYSSIGQHAQQQQHGPKDHQNMPPKQDKAIYSMPSYDPQVSFDLPEVSSQMKYSVDTYAGSNFKYTDKPQQQNPNKYQPVIQSQVQPLQHDSVTYSNDGKHNQQQNGSKSKGNQQQHAIRPPVNWMMTPEIKHNTNIADIILPPIGKELEFCQNNLFTQTPTYNQGTPNQFYNNYDVAAHGFPNLPVLQSEPKRTTDVFYSEEQPFPWSPTKTGVHVEQSQAVKGIDQHIVPSTLPTLVGDLDLGTNIPEKQNFLFGQVPARVPPEQSKDPTKDKEGNVTTRDFHAVLNTQNVQHPGPGSSFLSVSQLVDHEKAEKQHQQQHHHHHHHHHHPHPHQQQQQQQQQQARKHQRKTNASPRGNSKRQIDIRKQTSSNEQLHQRHEEQKSSGHSFAEQGYQQQHQQQKYQQNSVHWRSRNCKSNYTAEALIGTNNSVHDTSHQDKHASIKFTPNYPQNKFQTSLPTADAVMPINYFSNADDGSGYGQMVNQNFNSYAYTSNANIYPTSNFITSISNTPTSYMMPLHDNTDYMEANAFLLPNVAVSSATVSSTTSTTTTSSTNGSVNANTKNHQHYGKQQNCDKRNYSTAAKKGKRKALETTMQNLEFPLSGISSPLEDYHHSTTFLPPPPPHASPLYQNHPQANVYSKTVNGLPPPPVASAQSVPGVASAGFPMNPNMPRGGIVSSNPMPMSHHPSGTSLTNFNLSTIFPEMNDKITGYKPPNGIPSGLSQSANQSTTYAQRPNYPTNPLCHLPQVTEGSQFGNGVPPPPPPGVLHYKNV